MRWLRRLWELRTLWKWCPCELCYLRRERKDWTLADWAKHLDPGGPVTAVAGLMAQTNEILEDMVFVEGTQPVRIDTPLPEVRYTTYHRGVPAEHTYYRSGYTLP